MSTVHEWLAVRGERDACLQYTNDYQQEVRGIYVYSTRMIISKVRGIYVYSTQLAISKRWEGFMSTVHEWLSVRGERGLWLQYMNGYQ